MAQAEEEEGFGIGGVLRSSLRQKGGGLAVIRLAVGGFPEGFGQDAVRAIGFSGLGAEFEGFVVVREVVGVKDGQLA